MTSATYKDSGVDIEAGHTLVNNIRSIVSRTTRPEILSNIGCFSALCEVPLSRYKQPVLVSSTDGVGTKLKLALEAGHCNGLGIDLVAMCVNDILCQGAEPLFFLDYYATGCLNVSSATILIESIAKGCEQAGVALVGGETAEMPGLYRPNDFDLAGFCVGIVEKERIISRELVCQGDVLIAVASSGPHANGYSLIRHILKQEELNIGTEQLDGRPLQNYLLAPTRVYAKTVGVLLESQNIHGIAHITGGGLTHNLPRILPKQLKPCIDTQSWRWPMIFKWLQEKGKIQTEDMLCTFNCGVGLVLCVPSDETEACLKQLRDLGETAWQMGYVA